jgi:hypothetical protein
MRAVAILTLGGSRKHVRIDPKTAVSWRTPDMLILQITLELVQSAPGGAHGDAGAGARGRVQACLTNAGQLKQKPSEGESLELSCRWRARVPLWRLPREPFRKNPSLVELREQRAELINLRVAGFGALDASGAAQQVLLQRRQLRLVRDHPEVVALQIAIGNMLHDGIVRPTERRSRILFLRILATEPLGCTRALGKIGFETNSAVREQINRMGANSLGGFVYVPVGQRRRDRRLLLAPKFLAMAHHLAPPDTMAEGRCRNNPKLMWSLPGDLLLGRSLAHSPKRQ